MNNIFTLPEFEIIELNETDVVCSSGEVDDGTTPSGEFDTKDFWN